MQGEKNEGQRPQQLFRCPFIRGYSVKGSNNSRMGCSGLQKPKPGDAVALSSRHPARGILRGGQPIRVFESPASGGLLKTKEMAH